MTARCCSHISSRTQVHGIFINHIYHIRPHLFARPSLIPAASPEINAVLSFLPIDDDSFDFWSVMDHCNGLLLCDINGLPLCDIKEGARVCILTP